MPTIQINGAGAGGAGGGPGGLNGLWEKLLSNPSMATQREFLSRLNMLLPDNLFAHGSGAAGLTAALRSAIAQSRGAAGGGGSLQAAGSSLTAAAAALISAANRIAIAGGGGAAGGGAGGGRGGAGGGGGAFFGGGRGMPGPFRRAGHFGSGVGELLGALGLSRLAMLGGGIGAIGALAYEGVRLPTQIGHLEGSYLNEARPYTDLVKRLYAVGRAGGTPGGKLVKQFFPGEEWGKSYQTPGWMSTLGLTPDAVSQILQRYGIVPHGAGEAKTFARTLRLGALAPAFSGMAPGTVESLSRLGANLGIGNPQRPDYLLARIAPLMEMAVAKGMDRATVLRSMESSLSRLGGGQSFGTSLGGLTDFYNKLATSGLPGGRTGELQEQTLAGIQGSLGSVDKNAVVTMTLARAIGAHGGLATNKAFRSALPKTYAALMKTAAGRKLLGDIEATHAQPGIQMKLLAAALRGNPQEYAHFLEGGLPANAFGKGAAGHAMRRLAMSNITGEGIAGYYGLNYGGGSAPCAAADQRPLVRRPRRRGSVRYPRSPRPAPAQASAAV
jgi:hypothetical protein